MRNSKIICIEKKEDRHKNKKKITKKNNVFVSFFFVMRLVYFYRKYMMLVYSNIVLKGDTKLKVNIFPYWHCFFIKVMIETEI